MRLTMRTVTAGLSVLLCASYAGAQVRVDFDGARGPAAGRLIDAVRASAPPVAAPAGVVIEIDLGYGRGGVQFGYWNWERVKLIAHEVSRKADHVHYEAERRAHHGDHDEERALRDLHHLERAAEHFHEQVERYRQNPSHTRADFNALVNAYRQAQWSIRWSHAEAHIRWDFDALGRSLNELAFFYRFNDRDDHHGRDDHDRGGHGRGRRRPHHGFRW